MSEYKGEEKRKHSRLGANFVISYRIQALPNGYDLTQTKNVSQGGMMFTTNKLFEKGVCLAITIRFPFVPQKIEVSGIVIDSKEKVRDIIYETRIKFLNIDEQFFIDLGEFIREKLGNA